jgi:hypothetical protein
MGIDKSPDGWTGIEEAGEDDGGKDCSKEGVREAKVAEGLESIEVLVAGGDDAVYVIGKGEFVI